MADFRWRRAAIALLAVLLLAGCGQTTYTAAEHLERSVAFEAERKINAAIIEVKNALQQEPGNAEARWRLGTLHLTILDGATAHAELTRAVELGIDADRVRLPLMRAALLIGKPQQVLDESRLIDSFPEDQVTEALALRAQALLSRGDLAGAGKELAAASARDDAHADVLYGTAWLEILSRRHAEARRQLERLAELHPGYAKGHELRGDLERDAGNIDAAEAAYTAAIESSFQPFTPRVKRAMARIYREDYEAATQDLDTLERQYQRHPALSFGRGMVAFHTQRYPDAQRHFEQTLAASPNHMLSVYYLGVSHFAQGHWRQAENHLARFSSRYPDIGEAARLLALTRAREGDATRAESTLRAVLSRDPNDVAALRMISGIHMSQGRSQEALEQLRQVVSLDPDSARARAQLGAALLSQGDRQEGMSELEAAIALDPEGMASLEVVLVMERIRAGQNEEALEALAELQQRNPQDPLLFNLKGTAHLGQRDMAAAKAAFEQAIALMPGYAPAVRNLAALTVRQGDIDGGIAHLERGLRHNAQAVDLMLYLSNLQMRTGRVAAAGETLQRAVQVDPAALPPRLALSGNRLSAGQPQEAVRVLAEVQRRHGDSSDWMRQMALAQGAAGNGAEAAALVRKLIEREPDSVDLHFALARALALTDDRAGLQQALERVLALEPDHLGAGLALTRLHLSLQETDKAKARLGKMSAKWSDDPQVAMLNGQVAAQENRFQDAVKEFRRVVAAEPGNGAAVSALYQAQWAGGDRAGAITTARGWTRDHPEDHVARHNLALLYLAAGEEEAAIGELRIVAEHLPNNASVLNNLAWLLRAREPETALKLAERAVKLTPDSAGALDTLGSVQLELGRRGNALDTLGRALKLDPESAAIRLHYARALIENGRGTEARPMLETLLGEGPDANRRAEIERMLEKL